MHRTGGFEASSIPQNYTITDLSHDLDYYQLPCWNELVKSMDANTLRFMSDSVLNTCIDDVLTNLKERPRGLLEGINFCLYWKRQGELGASRRVLWPWDQAKLTDNAWDRIVLLMTSRGMHAKRIDGGKDSRLNISLER